MLLSYPSSSIVQLYCASSIMLLNYHSSSVVQLYLLCYLYCATILSSIDHIYMQNGLGVHQLWLPTVGVQEQEIYHSAA